MARLPDPARRTARAGARDGHTSHGPRLLPRWAHPRRRDLRCRLDPSSGCVGSPCGARSRWRWSGLARMVYRWSLAARERRRMAAGGVAAGTHQCAVKPAPAYRDSKPVWPSVGSETVCLSEGSTLCSLNGSGNGSFMAGKGPLYRVALVERTAGSGGERSFCSSGAGCCSGFRPLEPTTGQLDCEWQSTELS